jgi:hypothetical protein
VTHFNSLFGRLVRPLESSSTASGSSPGAAVGTPPPLEDLIRQTVATLGYILPVPVQLRAASPDGSEVDARRHVTRGSGALTPGGITGVAQGGRGGAAKVAAAAVAAAAAASAAAELEMHPTVGM